MKGNKIIIILILINILLIGVIYNFIKKDYLNNEKIIVKAMTETEYEDYITSLNQSHIDYANYIQESKTKIASAITDMGVTTSNDATPETMSNNIKSIARNASLINYDNTSSELAATNVQAAVDELNDSLVAEDNLKFRFATDGEGNYGYLGADDSFIPFKCDVKLVKLGTGNSFNIADIVGVKNVGKYSINDFLIVPSINTSAYQFPNINVISGQNIAKANTRIYTNKDFSISYDNTNGNVRVQNGEIMNNINFYNSSNTLLGDYWITFSIPPNVYLLVKTGL